MQPPRRHWTGGPERLQCPARPGRVTRLHPLTLTIARLNDHHSQLEPIPAVELVLDGVATQVELGGFARQTTLFRQQQASTKNLLKLHAGDAVTGTLYYTFFKGAADARRGLRRRRVGQHLPALHADHVTARDTVSRPAAADYAHQRVISATGVALP